ncbi:MAG: hypothetical protein ACI4SF_01580, partial [Oscillospiraceae bacterium]
NVIVNDEFGVISNAYVKHNEDGTINVCIAIYAVLVQNMIVDTNVSTAIWSCVGYTVLLCFTLFKTGSLAKSVFNAH